jgi:hypothetical protein
MSKQTPSCLRTIPLVCVACSAPLKVPERVKAFCCARCRSPQELRLEGGIAFTEAVSGSLLLAGTELPRAETDPLAARLALQQIAAERKVVDAELRRVTIALSETFGERLDQAHRQALLSVMFGCCVLIGALFVLAFWDSAFGAAGVATGVGLGVFLGTAIGNVVVAFRNANALQDEIVGRVEAVRSSFQQELTELARAFDVSREVAESG